MKALFTGVEMKALFTDTPIPDPPAGMVCFITLIVTGLEGKPAERRVWMTNAEAKRLQRLPSLTTGEIKWVEDLLCYEELTVSEVLDRLENS